MMNAERAASKKKKVIPNCIDVNILCPSKRAKMNVNNKVCAGSSIKIEQLVKHDVWDIRKKDDGVFVLKKLKQNEPGAATNGELTVNAESNVNPQQAHTSSGARPKVTINVPTKNSGVLRSPGNTSKNVITLNAVAPPAQKVVAMRTDAQPTTAAAPVSLWNLNAASISSPAEGVITLRTNAQPKEVITLKSTPAPVSLWNINTASAPDNKVITVQTSPASKREVITLNSTKAQKPNVITINTTNACKPDVITLNTVSSFENGGASSSQTSGNVGFKQQELQTKLGVSNIHKKAKESQNSNELLVKDESDSSILCLTSEAHQVQEMFPEIPLYLIEADLMNTGSVETTVDNILEGKLVAPVLSSVPQVLNKADKISLQQPKKSENTIPESKKKGSVIKIELLAKSEVWDISKKGKQGFVMKKILPDNATDSQSSKSDNVSSAVITDYSTQAVEHEFENTIADDYIDVDDDDMPYKALPEGTVPVKMMVYSQSPVSKRKGDVSSDGEKVETPMEINNFDQDDICMEENFLLNSFDFSDDENDEGETVEHFLFKASLVLKKLKHLNELGKQGNGSDSAYLNITGSITNEKTGDGSMNNEKTDEESTNNEKTGDADLVEESSEDDDYCTDECCTDENDQEFLTE